MKLLEVLRQITEGEDSDTTIEFPNQNFVVSVFPVSRKLIFVPQFHSSLPLGMKINILKLLNDFRIQKTNTFEDSKESTNNIKGSFEMIVDPRENFAEVVTALKNMAGEEVR